MNANRKHVKKTSMFGTLTEQMQEVPRECKQDVSLNLLSEEQILDKPFFEGNIDDLERELENHMTLEELDKFDLNRIEFPNKEKRNKIYQKIYYLRKRELKLLERKGESKSPVK